MECSLLLSLTESIAQSSHHRMPQPRHLDELVAAIRRESVWSPPSRAALTLALLAEFHRRGSQ